MEPNQMQEEMTPEDAKAVLGFATRLSEQLLPQAPPEASTEPSQEPEIDLGQEETPQVDIEVMETKMTEMETRIMDKIESLKEELKPEPDEKEKEIEN